MLQEVIYQKAVVRITLTDEDRAQAEATIQKLVSQVIAGADQCANLPPITTAEATSEVRRQYWKRWKASVREKHPGVRFSFIGCK